MPTCRRYSRSLCALGLAALVGCAPEFRAASELDDTAQILAVVAEPPSVGAGESVSLDALVHLPSGNLGLFWLACIPQVGDSLTTCVINALDTISDPPFCSGDPEERVCIIGFGSGVSYTVPVGVFPDDGLDHTIFVALLATTDGVVGIDTCQAALEGGTSTPDCLLALKRVVVSSEVPRNQNPTIREFTVDGAGALPGETATVIFAPEDPEKPEKFVVELGVAADPASIDDLAAEDDAVSLVVSWFTTCGRVDPDRSFLACERDDQGVLGCEAATTSWKPLEPGTCRIHTVTRDGEGGAVVRSQSIDVQ